MSAYRYTAAVRGILEHLEGTQADNIEAAAGHIIHALTHQGAVFCSEIGHGIQGDFLNRAGGLAAVQFLNFGLSVTDPVADCLANRPDGQGIDREIETIRLAVRAGNLRAGDVVMVGSVSGRNIRPIELALACNEIGVHSVAFTSLTYTANVQSLHPSGKRLSEAAETVIDIGAPYGDAAMTIPGIDTEVGPVSGVSMAVAGWMIWERVMTRMADAGDPPTVFMSFNRAGGADYYARSREQYNKRGY